MEKSKFLTEYQDLEKWRLIKALLGKRFELLGDEESFIRFSHQMRSNYSKDEQSKFQSLVDEVIHEKKAAVSRFTA